MSAAAALVFSTASPSASADDGARRARSLFQGGCETISLLPQPAEPCEWLAQVPAETVPPAPSAAPRPSDSPEPRQKHFWTAAGEMALLEAGPWAFDRYVLDEEFARISWHTVSENFKSGFGYDSDTFNVNQSSHPYHGSLFFEAGRSNGYSYWESGLFALSGSFIWECCMENTRPSINDLVNTTLGGMTRGEIAHRLSIIILDNTVTGGERFWRELGAAIVNPVGALSRLARGDMTRDFPNPDERYPGSFAVSADLGYRHVGGSASRPDQGTFSLSALYGDPFAGDIHKPFDTFWVGADLNTPGGAVVSRIEERGILRGWELTDPSDAVRHVVGFSQEYEYLNNEAQVVGAQAFSGGILSKYRIGKLAAATDLTVLAVPLAGIQTTDFATPQTGRNYDYGAGGGARAEARLYGGPREIAAAGYGVIWAHTLDGVSENNRLEFFRGEIRIPVSGALGVGGSYSWYSRKTTYSGFFESQRTQNEWRAFVNVAAGSSRRPPP
ncbi:MAG TPA: DUF3943 domain-containing protein [Thermoanaerobaculia bacterium]|nr:DUF3943 domain-containing protein [Thermoanaerobaculia bacterium]